MTSSNTPEPVEPQRIPAELAATGWASAGTAGEASMTAGAQAPPHRWGLGAFFLVQVVFLLSAALLQASFSPLDPGKIPSEVLLTLVVAPTVLAAAAAVLVTVVRGNGPVIDLRLRWNWADIRVGLGLGLIGLMCTFVAANLWAIWVGQENASSAVSSLLTKSELPPVASVLVFLHLWLLAPACEEIIYRGLLWGAMERLQWSRWMAFVLSTAVFAMAHLEPSRTPLLLVIAIPIGLARLFTGRLLASVIAHMLNNFLPALGILLVTLGAVPG